MIRGKSSKDHQLLARGVCYSAIPVVSLDKVHDICFFEGTVDGVKFEYFLRNCVLPFLSHLIG